MNKKLIIFDLDGTLALIDHRRHLVENGNNKWDEFYQKCIMDEINYPICYIFCRLVAAQYEVQIWSGRSNKVEKETRQWLLEYLGVGQLHADIKIKMRPDGDYTPDDKLKEKWLLEAGPKNVLMVFDDRQKVVDMWRSHGVTCLQVAKGDF